MKFLGAQWHFLFSGVHSTWASVPRNLPESWLVLEYFYSLYTGAGGVPGTHLERSRFLSHVGETSLSSTPRLPSWPAWTWRWIGRLGSLGQSGAAGVWLPPFTKSKEHFSSLPSTEVLSTRWFIHQWPQKSGRTRVSGLLLQPAVQGEAVCCDPEG